MEKEMCKLKELWESDFDSLNEFFQENIRAWIVVYINTNES